MKIRRVAAAPENPLPCFELMADSEAGTVIGFRVELADRTVSFARTEIRRWTLLHEDPQRLLVHISLDLVVCMVGKGLEVLHAAMDRDRLLTVRISKQQEADGPWIKSIELVVRPEPPAAG